MKHVKTQGFRISEETYSLAVALLPPAFATIPFDKVKDHVVVINSFDVLVTTSNNSFNGYFRDREETQVLTIDNSWISPEGFDELYSVTDDSVKIMLTEITEK